MTTEAAARELREELGEIAAIERCAGCDCLLGVAGQAPHGCLECDPCLPVEPYRRFRAALGAAGAASSGDAAPHDLADDRAGAASGGCPGCGCGGRA